MAIEILNLVESTWVASLGHCNLWRGLFRSGETLYLVHVSRLSSWPTWLCAFPPGFARVTKDRRGRPVLVFAAPDDSSARKALMQASSNRLQLASQLKFFVGHGFADR